MRKRRHQLPTPSGLDDKFVAETLGVAGGQKTHDKAWQCEATNGVFGRPGHQDGLRRGETEAHCTNH